MTILGIPILSLLIFFPILGAVVLLFINQENARAIRVVTLIFSLIESLLCLRFDDGSDAIRRGLVVGPILRDQLQIGDRWDQPPSGSLGYLFDNPLHPLFLDSDHLPGKGIHDFVPLP